jgi:hypothetical protein|uniref:Uncharacterized protein n=1 Tax=Picea glauca TaxID=3330 RepID=A0A117NGR3_PICGL|nr:hypothetical protein ABT39_MTgene6143 [Picea glauca]
MSKIVDSRKIGPLRINVIVPTLVEVVVGISSHLYKSNAVGPIHSIEMDLKVL